MTEYRRSYPQELAGARLISFSVALKEDYLFVEIEGLLQRDFTSEEIQSIRDYLSDYIGRPIQLRIRWGSY